jgi:hypothetical protein
MLVANKKRKQKTRYEILDTANDHIQSYRSSYFWNQRIYYILVGVWGTAFSRGYAKALHDVAKEDVNASAELMLLKRRKA